MKLDASASLFFNLDWLIFLSIAFVWVVLFFLFKDQKDQVRRKKSRQIAERAAEAGDPYRAAERIEVDARIVEGLSQQELQRLTDEFVRLGFVHVLDYRLRLPGRSDLIGFGRALVNRESSCFGEVMATQKSLEGKEPLLFGLDSYLEDGWRIGSVNRRPHKIDYLHRLPRSLTLMLPDATLGQLFQRHLELRKNVAGDLGLQLLTDLSLEARFKKVAESQVLMREALLRSDVLAELADARGVEEENSWEWLGDYPQEKVRRIKGKKLLSIPETFPVYTVPQKDALETLDKQKGDSSDDEANR